MPESKKYCLYYHLNMISHKIYIGITSQKLEARWGKYGQGYKNNSHFFASIQKYGWNNFLHGIIYSNLSQSEAFEYEKQFILAYDAQNPKFGYNITNGGQGSSGWKMNEAQKQALHERLKKQFDTPEKRIEWGKKHCNHYVSDEYRKKMSEARKGKNNPAARAVVCLETNQKFDTIKEAAHWCHLKSASKISDVCRGKSIHAGKHPLTQEYLSWRYV